MRYSAGCTFCKILKGELPADIVESWDDAVAITPLNPVTPFHTLIIPRTHVTDFASDPVVTAMVMSRAALLASERARFHQCNLITSRGEHATQTVFHLHVHLVPRTHNDGLHLPWTVLHESVTIE